jgi:hypothetical protein
VAVVAGAPITVTDAGRSEPVGPVQFASSPSAYFCITGQRISAGSFGFVAEKLNSTVRSGARLPVHTAPEMRLALSRTISSFHPGVS